MRTKQSFYFGLLVLIGAVSLSWAQFQSKTLEAYTSVGITEADNLTFLQGNTETGDLVQLIAVGPNGIIDLPDSLGHTTADDTLLGVSHIGYGYPFNPDQGLFAAFFRHDLLIPATIVYVRAWNDSAVTNGSAFGNSLPYTINSDFDSHDFGLDFRAPSRWHMHGGLVWEPVELAMFTATAEGDHVLLRWSTYSESDNLGFNIYRAAGRDSSRSRINDRLIDGALNSQVLNNYQFFDHPAVENQKFFYWLADVTAKGDEIMHGPISMITAAIPGEFDLRQNYPNPFNPTTSISYSIKEVGQVNVRIYNIRGQLVRELVNATQGPGQYSVMWNGRDMNDQQVPSGTYLCTMEASNYRSFIKMTMTK